MSIKTALLALLLAAVGTPAGSQPEQAAPPEQRPTLQVIGTAHLDTQWRWTIRNSIDEYIPDTFRRNLALMAQYPQYVFSFEGAFRYMLMEEYYREDFERIRPYVQSGQWRVTGSWVDAVDVNIPSFESLVRQTLYGNGYFRKEFGRTSRDIFLPDCFGFGYALPSIARHCGLRSFSTQKLGWGCWVGIPFDIGVWRGVDGATLLCGVNPGEYVSRITGDLSRDTTWLGAARRQGEKSGLFAAYRYFGTGDTGGSPDSASVDRLVASMQSDGPLRVVSAGADDLVDLLAGVDTARLPHFDGELVMTRHGAGCYTSQAAMKRWNRRNELLAEAAERAAVIAARRGGSFYPRGLLRDTWIRFLWHQFHDDLTGTSIPEAYEFSWNDELLCQNRFAALLTGAVEATAGALDTRTQGIPLVVFNPLGFDREDVVEAAVHFGDRKTRFVRVFGPDGREAPADAVPMAGDSLRLRFLARVPSVGYAVFDARPADAPCPLATGLRVSPRELENERYRVGLNEKGEVASIYDKKLGRELLGAPVRYELLEDTPHNWPAWEVDYEDVMAPARDEWAGDPVIAVVEEGCARVAVSIERRTASSTLRTIVSLAAGEAGERVEFQAAIDWYERERMLKLAVSPATANETVTYDLGLGVIERGRNSEKRYEVPGHQWADLAAPAGDWGVAVLNDCRYGWDHPDSATVRLTLVRTPGVGKGWDWVGDQRSQDLGRHLLGFALQGHAGDWRSGGVVRQGARFNQPLQAFRAQPHEGELGKTYSLVRAEETPARGGAATEAPGVMIAAVKMAEECDEIIIRVRETAGAPRTQAALAFDRPIAAAREVNGAEENVGPAEVADGRLVVSLTAFQPKAFAVTLDEGVVTDLLLPWYSPLELPYDGDGVSTDDERCGGDFDGRGYSLAGELLPDTLDYLDIPFVLGPRAAGASNMLTCRGQQVPLPGLGENRLWLLAAAVDGPAVDTFRIGGRALPVELPDYAAPLGQWHNRVVDGQLVESPSAIAPAYLTAAPVAWYGSHRHTPECGNDIYRFTYAFLVSLEVPPGATAVALPNNARIRVLAATVGAKPHGDVTPARPLYDETRATVVKVAADSGAFAGRCRLTLSSPTPGAAIYYTLDGTEPSVRSARYTAPVAVDRTTTLRARAVRDGYDNSYVAERTVHRLELRAPVSVEGLAAGLTARYYEGEWERLPRFDTLTAAAEFTAETVALPPLARQEDFGLLFEGYIRVPADGMYAFSINSDDGSRLYVADTLVVDNDGLHGDTELSGLIGLKAGLHRFTVQMFQGKGGSGLGVSIAGPSLAKQALPAGWLWRPAP
ncbi:MAG TPA: glycoside hydrolase family 38 C-terminal domain-containing protein [candidate division Zixibacteria bacterium]|nr:chitobiase/beta-hexosaminidase C-terminal domain-containing protein [candidate division Zixibacteria bacterium]MDD4916450.1 glycoside hydrolase family 38 C-terminal domain-containing protein [candidate division Zixibacteria bacterium]MDM7972893.1 glycoside hydrolase family 38 C-terminal domain-containing protein [candidate division Zixibacteria bacterium]HPM37755.1 glycoside hydrolase family 38 C-terminal domain-containing protein [candidate division Zixibacteria bacterium]